MGNPHLSELQAGAPGLLDYGGCLLHLFSEFKYLDYVPVHTLFKRMNLSLQTCCRGVKEHFSSFYLLRWRMKVTKPAHVHITKTQRLI